MYGLMLIVQYEETYGKHIEEAFEQQQKQKSEIEEIESKRKSDEKKIQERQEQERIRAQNLKEEEEIKKKEEEEIKLKQLKEEQERKRQDQEKIRLQLLKEEQERVRKQEEELKQKQLKEEEERKRQEQERIKLQLLKEEQERGRKQEEELKQKQLKEEEERKRQEQERLRLQFLKEQEENQKLKQLKEEEERKRQEQERIKQIQEKENEKMKILQQEEQKYQLEQFQKQKIQIIQNRIKTLPQKQYKEMQCSEKNLQFVNQQIKAQKEITTKPPSQQIQILQYQIERIQNDTTMTVEQQQYYKAQFSQQIINNLKQIGQATPISIPHMSQKVEKTNPEVMLYVLKEQLLRDQNKELLKTNIPVSKGLDQLVGTFGEDQCCLRLRTTQVDYNSLINNEKMREQYLLEFKQKVANLYQISIDEVEILDITKGSSVISFQIKSKTAIQTDIDSIKFLENICGGSIDYYNYYVGVNQKAGMFGLSNQDFNPQFNMNWDNFHEKEERGPPYQRYQYYFPKGCQGFGLNVDIKSYGSNQEWLQMNGNQNEWRILYHGTKQHFVGAITKNNLKPGTANGYASYNCLDEFGNTVKVGNGIYFSDKIDICIDHGYATPVSVGEKNFVIIFMSRVNPKKIRQSNEMKSINYFVVNESKDVRPYRILLKEVISKQL